MAMSLSWLVTSDTDVITATGLREQAGMPQLHPLAKYFQSAISVPGAVGGTKPLALRRPDQRADDYTAAAGGAGRCSG